MEFMRKNSIPINEKTALECELLKECLITYKSAIKEVERNGLIISNNNGKTTNANPAVKIKLDCTKLIIRLLKDLTHDDNMDEESVDDFIRKLTGEE